MVIKRQIFKFNNLKAVFHNQDQTVHHHLKILPNQVSKIKQAQVTQILIHILLQLQSVHMKNLIQKQIKAW